MIVGLKLVSFGMVYYPAIDNHKTLLHLRFQQDRGMSPYLWLYHPSSQAAWPIVGFQEVFVE